MVHRRRYPLPLAVASATTVLWGASTLILVGLPWTVAHRAPGPPQALSLWLLTGAVVAGLSWWSAWRYVRARAAVATTLAELRALSPATFGWWDSVEPPSSGLVAGTPRATWDGDTAVPCSSASTVTPRRLPATAGIPVCPVCGAALVDRRSPQTGERFLGCTRYPACRHTAAQPAFG